jgi:hypothetical protein
MYSGKIAVPPGGGGLKYISVNTPKNSQRTILYNSLSLLITNSTIAFLFKQEIISVDM